MWASIHAYEHACAQAKLCATVQHLPPALQLRSGRSWPVQAARLRLSSCQGCRDLDSPSLSLCSCDILLLPCIEACCRYCSHENKRRTCVQAVESEFSGVLQSDGQRLEQLRCFTAAQGHILNRFSWGNELSLKAKPQQKGIDVRQGLLDYYKCAQAQNQGAQ